MICTNSAGGLQGAKSTYQDCVKNPNSTVGLITCDKDYGCPAFFQDGADQTTDQTSGWVCFFLSLFFLVICLIFLIKVLSSLLLGASQRILRKATDLNGYVAMLLGVGVTVLVQSSSITTSVLTPLAGLDIISLEVRAKTRERTRAPPSLLTNPQCTRRSCSRLPSAPTSAPPSPVS